MARRRLLAAGRASWRHPTPRNGRTDSPRLAGDAPKARDAYLGEDPRRQPTRIGQRENETPEKVGRWRRRFDNARDTIRRVSVHRSEAAVRGRATGIAVRGRARPRNHLRRGGRSVKMRSEGIRPATSDLRVAFGAARRAATRSYQAVVALSGVSRWIDRKRRSGGENRPRELKRDRWESSHRRLGASCEALLPSRRLPRWTPTVERDS